MLISGEKWACEACVRGHRVSNCQHTDRPLIHIKPKGRPTTQCNHCRAMRKSRSSHIRCDCGEKTHKCMHLQASVEGHRDSCCCHHGRRCTCSHKKEHPQLEPVLESGQDTGPAPSYMPNPPSPAESSPQRSRASTTNSDGGLLPDARGNHAPLIHEHVQSAQASGPYPLQHGHSLSSANRLFGNRSDDNLLHENLTSFADHLAQDSAVLRCRSQDASPLLAGSPLTDLNGTLPPLDLSGIKFQPYGPNNADLFAKISDTSDQPMFSAGLSAASIDWSLYEGLGGSSSSSTDFAPSSFSQASAPPLGLGIFDFSGAEQMPTLPAVPPASSGGIEEVDDLFTAPFGDLGTSRYDRAATGTMLGPHMEAMLNQDAKLLADHSTYGCDGRVVANASQAPQASVVSGDDESQDDPALSQWPHIADLSTSHQFPSTMPAHSAFWSSQRP